MTLKRYWSDRRTHGQTHGLTHGRTGRRTDNEAKVVSWGGTYILSIIVVHTESVFPVTVTRTAETSPTSVMKNQERQLAHTCIVYACFCQNRLRPITFVTVSLTIGIAHSDCSLMKPCYKNTPRDHFICCSNGYVLPCVPVNFNHFFTNDSPIGQYL